MEKEITLEYGSFIFLRCEKYNIDSHCLPNSVEPSNVKSCLNYVYNCGDTSDMFRKISVKSYDEPIIIKEIGVSQESRKTFYRFWMFREDRFHIIEFDYDPPDREINDAIDDIFHYESRQIHYFVNE